MKDSNLLNIKKLSECHFRNAKDASYFKEMLTRNQIEGFANVEDLPQHQEAL